MTHRDMEQILDASFDKCWPGWNDPNRLLSFGRKEPQEHGIKKAVILRALRDGKTPREAAEMVGSNVRYAYSVISREGFSLSDFRREAENE